MLRIVLKVVTGVDQDLYSWNGNFLSSLTCMAR
jgi:hypothetical protein